MEQIKKYTGYNMTEILDRIRDDLGSDAIIIKSSSKQKLISGKKEFEVIAGLENKIEKQVPRITNFIPEKIIQTKIPATNENKIELKREIKNEIIINEESKILCELKDLKLLLSDFVPKEISNIPESIRKVQYHLLNNGADKEAVIKLINKIKNILKDKINIVSFSQAVKIAKAIIEKDFKEKFQNTSERTKNINIFIGPTGAGKTTTLAKLASIALFQHKKNIALISIDSYKLGAHEQLKTYADILSVPFYTANNETEIKKIINQLPLETEIFIDTSGINPLNTLSINKLKTMFSNVIEANIFLLIPAAYPISYFKKIIDQFSIINYQSIILTKTDEICSLGHLLSLPDNIKRIDYITNGQEVPKDILKFSPNFIAERIMQVE